MPPGSLLVITLILTGVPAVISFFFKLKLPGVCFHDVRSCLRHTMFENSRIYRYYVYYCRYGCRLQGFRV